jgi:amino acid adenylation domain-containing protein
VQVVTPPQPFALPVTDLSALPVSEREVEAQRLADEEAQRPFDLTVAPLLRAGLLRLSEEEHVLLITMHHIVSDGWSSGIFFRELNMLYGAARAGTQAALPELEVQYADFAVWQREYLSGEVLEEQLSYWKQQLKGAPAVLELPTDRPRPAMQGYRGAKHTFSLARQTSERLKELSRQEGVTLFMTLLAAFQVLLSRYSGQEDIVVGSTIAGRNNAEVEPLIGFFVNALVLRTDLSGNPSFRHLLHKVKEVCLGAYAHQDVPFEKLVEELQPERSLGYQPLFQVVFQLHNGPGEAMRLADHVCSQFRHAAADTAKFDLNLGLTPTPQGLAGSITYSADLFDHASIQRMAEHFQLLLDSICQTPDQRILSLRLLSVAQERQILTQFNNTATDFPEALSVAELFAQQAANTPETVAVVAQGQSISYRELNERANRLAHYLRARGVMAESVVALSLERSVEMIVAMLGVIKAGAAFMLEDAGAAVLLTQEHLLAVLPERAARLVVCLDRDWPAIERESAEDPATVTDGGNLVYIIYTSGSTGVPKGVMVKQRSLLNLCYALREFFADPLVRQVALITSISFDISVNQIFPTLLFGKTLHVIANEVKCDSRAVMSYAASASIDLMDCVPSYLNSVLSELSNEPLGQQFKYLLIGGEKVERSLLRKVFAQLGEQVQVVNIYGLTELTDINALARIGSLEADDTVTVGYPVANTQIYITNGGGELQPVGVVGELCIGGGGVARGYRNRPAMTAEKFVVNPYKSGELMCRTGDVGRWLKDGRIEVLGRKDSQVKMRGFRVELGEIEAVLDGHPAVTKSAVVLRTDMNGGEPGLVAYVVKAAHGAATSGELRAWLRERLPEHMVPAWWVELERLPETPNGKIDRKALPAPEPQAESAETYVGPRNPIEEQLAGLWVEVLKVVRVGMHDSFFELGGHSLLATSLVTRMRDAFQVELPLRTVFEFPTPALLAEKIAEQQASSLSRVAARIEVRPRGEKGLEQLLSELALLSEEEIRAVLTGEGR